MQNRRRKPQVLLNDVFALFLIFSLFACSSTKIPPQEYKGDVITFGNGGGFSGIENTIAIHENGNVFRITDRGTSYEPVSYTHLTLPTKRIV